MRNWNSPSLKIFKFENLQVWKSPNLNISQYLYCGAKKTLPPPTCIYISSSTMFMIMYFAMCVCLSGPSKEQPKICSEWTIVDGWPPLMAILSLLPIYWMNFWNIGEIHLQKNCSGGSRDDKYPSPIMYSQTQSKLSFHAT